MSYEAVMEAVKDRLTASASARVVQRGMVLDPAQIKAADLEKGVLCVMSKGGGAFWNYQGREGDGGDLDIVIVGFISVGEKTEPVAIEQAEFGLIEDLLTFCRGIEHGDEILSAVVPLSWNGSGQLEHPFGWIAMKLKARWL